MKRTTTRNKLVKKWAEHKSSKDFQKALGSKQYGSGIYILYKGKSLYYIGKSNRSIRGRIKKHMKDHHQKKWDNFSFYQIRKVKYVGDIERLLLQCYRPAGNRQGGKFRSRLRVS